jgi:hypothetical protein
MGEQQIGDVVNVPTDDQLEEIDWLTPGRAVFTANNDLLGVVKEVAGDRFKVDAPMHLDYWLARADVVQRGLDDVVTTFVTDDLAAHKVDRPPLDGEPTLV